MKTRRKDYSKATCPAGTGTPGRAAPGDQTKSAKQPFSPPKNPLKPAKDTLRIATWNIRTLLKPEAKHLLADDMNTLGIEVACLQETRIAGDTTETIQDSTGAPSLKLYASGYDSPGLHGVAIGIHIRLANHVMEWRACGARICYMRLHAIPVAISINCAYAPIENSSERDKEAFYSELQKCLKDVPKKDVLVVGGDFNAKVGLPLDGEKQNIGRFATGSRNANGELLAHFAVLNDLVISNTTFQKKRHSLYTWRSNDNRTKNQIDYMLISRRWRTSVNNTFNTKLFLTDTDHKPVISVIRLRLKAYTKKAKTIAYNLGSLRKPAVADEFKDTLHSLFDAAEETGDDVEAKWWQLKSILHQAAEKSLGKSEQKRNAWISSETIELIKKRARARNRSKKAELRKTIKKAVRKDKTMYFDTLAQEMIDADETGNLRKVYSVVKQLAGKRSAISETVKSADGHPVKDAKQRIEEWAKHFEKLLNRPPPATADITGNEHKPLSVVSTDPPSLMEVRTAISKLKRRKAGGLDNIPPEFFLDGGIAPAQELTKLLQCIWASVSMPMDWKTAVIVPLFKKGDKTNCANYRGISLLSIAFKILEAVIKNRLEPAYIGRANQAGFKKNKGCRDQIFALRQILEQREEFKRLTNLVFIDFKAAFDSVDRMCIWRICENLGLPDTLLNVLRMLYAETYSQVRVYGTMSRQFRILSGVRQCSILAPFLFNLAIDWIMEEALRNDNVGVSLDDTIIADLDFADDICLMDDNGNDAQRLLDNVAKNAAAVGLYLNVGKTKFCSQDINLKFHVYGEELERVEDFTYLGSKIQPDGNVTSEIKARIGKAAGSFKNLKNIWNQRSIPQLVKVKIYKACVRSVLLYGCESWPTKDSDINSLQSFENRCLRRILHKGQDLPAESITTIAKCDSLATTIQTRRLRWLGHVLRMNPTEIPNAALEFVKGDNWKRPPGGIRKTWRRMVRDEVKKHIKPPKMSAKKWETEWFDLCKETAQNRKQWRGLIRDLNVAG